LPYRRVKPAKSNPVESKKKGAETWGNQLPREEKVQKKRGNERKPYDPLSAIERSAVTSGVEGGESHKQVKRLARSNSDGRLEKK